MATQTVNGKVNRVPSAQSVAKSAPTNEDLLAQINTLKAELAKAQEKKAGVITYKVTVPHQSSDGTWTKSEGAVSIYGLGRFPITLYVEQLERLIADYPNTKKFIADNNAVLVRRHD